MDSWRQTMQQALYGQQGFFTTGAGAAAHFRTSVHAAPEFAGAIARLVTEIDDVLGGERFQVVDVGAGDGEFLMQLDAALPPQLRSRADLVAVELRDRPSQLPDAIRWTNEIPDHTVGLLIANEWLDNVPLDVCEKAPHGVVQVNVDRSGDEKLGAAIDPTSVDWLARWWPQTEAADGDRAEIGLTRDTAWRTALTKLDRGVAVAIDYGHMLTDRRQGVYASGTMRGFRDGQVVAPLPDGSCDITADVAMDACADAGSDLATQSLLTSQRHALTALGVDAQRPPLELAHHDPAVYVGQLSAASRAGELINAEQLGGYLWLVQTRNCHLPPSMVGLPSLA